MANLSQKKREEMLAFLERLKEQHSDDKFENNISKLRRFASRFY